MAGSQVEDVSFDEQNIVSSADDVLLEIEEKKTGENEKTIEMNQIMQETANQARELFLSTVIFNSTHDALSSSETEESTSESEDEQDGGVDVLIPQQHQPRQSFGEPAHESADMMLAKIYHLLKETLPVLGKGAQYPPQYRDYSLPNYEETQELLFKQQAMGSSKVVCKLREHLDLIRSKVPPLPEQELQSIFGLPSNQKQLRTYSCDDGLLYLYMDFVCFLPDGASTLFHQPSATPLALPISHIMSMTDSDTLLIWDNALSIAMKSGHSYEFTGLNDKQSLIRDVKKLARNIGHRIRSR